jgi:hypothetical protein
MDPLWASADGLTLARTTTAAIAAANGMLMRMVLLRKCS